jgi:hypothetical protein
VKLRFLVKVLKWLSFTRVEIFYFLVKNQAKLRPIHLSFKLYAMNQHENNTAFTIGYTHNLGDFSMVEALEICKSTEKSILKLYKNVSGGGEASSKKDLARQSGRTCDLCRIIYQNQALDLRQPIHSLHYHFFLIRHFLSQPIHSLHHHSFLIRHLRQPILYFNLIKKFF